MSIHSTKRTKIVATIGPSTEQVPMLEKLVRAGLNVARLNMSHGTHEEHRERIKRIRQVSDLFSIPVGILLDLSGPKIRTGTYISDRITITPGDQLILTTEDIIGDNNRISISYKKLPQEVNEGSVIMVDDGKKQLQVLSVKGNDIVCRVIVGGELKPRRGINVPGAHLSIPSITEKDREDLLFGLAEGVDMIALSFVRRVEDIDELRTLLREKEVDLPIIAKIETQESIENLAAILAAADGTMVARGDLAIEVPAEKVPLYQKNIIEQCRMLGKPVITATQMLESMIHSPVPTRAEVSDVANAIFDGTDAVMLSEETTLGSYPEEAISVMARIASTVEHSLSKVSSTHLSVVDAISASVTQAAQDVGAKLIVALTESGTTAQMVARFNPPCPIIALTPHRQTVHKLTLVSGVYPYQIDPIPSLDAGLERISTFLKEQQLAEKGDRVIIAAGIRFGVSGSTNMLFCLELS